MLLIYGRFSGDHVWPVLGVHRGTDPHFQRLMIRHCKISTVTLMAKSAIQHLKVTALEFSCNIQFRRFTALSKDLQRLYVPIKDTSGRILQISACSARLVTNGSNEDKVWVEHPHDDPFEYSERDPLPGLELFGTQVMDTMPCSPAMRLFVAMHAVCLPFVRDACPQRPILLLRGPSQEAGKTSAAQRATILLGLGEVLGDWTPAALSNLKDGGLLVMDNREQNNMPPQFIDFCLFLATGAQRGRSNPEGGIRTSKNRPVAIMTSVEGVFKQELQNRCVNVDFKIPPGAKKLRRAENEREIATQRNIIVSALIPVFRRFFQIHGQQPTEAPSGPISNFPEYHDTIADLARAFGYVAGKPSSWAEDQIKEWSRIISNVEQEECDLEGPICTILSNAYSLMEVISGITFQGRKGTLYVTEANKLRESLLALKQNGLEVPRSPGGLSSRLKSSKFVSFQFLHWEFESVKVSGIAEMVRKGRKKPIGFFIPDDDLDQVAVTD